MNGIVPFFKNSHSIRICFLAGLPLLVVGLSQEPAQTQLSLPTCDTVQVTLTNKPKALHFKGCDTQNLAQGRQLIARYSVSGKDAVEVESYLVDAFEMAPLKFLCCGWEPVLINEGSNTRGLGHFKDSEGFDYSIGMFSEETTVNQREDWPTINSFSVQIKVYLDPI